jgi:hypothetical protein
MFVNLASSIAGITTTTPKPNIIQAQTSTSGRSIGDVGSSGNNENN